MTVYELSDLMNGVNSNIIAGQAVFLTVVSAYLAVAYSVGKNLSVYQVCFINFIFLLFMFVGYFAMSTNMEMIYAYNSEKLALLDQKPSNQTLGNAAKLVFLGMRLAIAVGALIFMWQVRHAKTE